jgi:hypothetical protein
MVFIGRMVEGHLMKFVLVALVIISASIAKADGFLCETQSGLRLKVFNHVAPSRGTRAPAVMVVSDAGVQFGRKTIAVFRDADAQLLVEDDSYLAKVDLRRRESSRQGELLAGTKLGNVDQIKLYVDFSYNNPVNHGAELTGTMTLLKRDAGLIVEQAICTRYLKN